MLLVAVLMLAIGPLLDASGRRWGGADHMSEIMHRSEEFHSPEIGTKRWPLARTCYDVSVRQPSTRASAAASISSRVVDRPRVSRTEPSASWGAMPMAVMV